MNDLNYWEKKWNEVGKNYTLNKNTTKENINIWNNSSKDYDESVGSERIDEVIETLENRGYINEDSTVLDLGCGTGAYSIALSGVCKNVDALDYSDGMLEALKEKIKFQGINNINIIKDDWNSLDLKDNNMYKKYDFILCSLNPGCYSSDALFKMNESSKGYCCYIGTDGMKNNNILDKCDYEILGKNIDKNDISNIIYPFNILYFNNYRPIVFYTPCNWIYKMDKEKAISKLIKRYKKYIDIDEKVMDKLECFVTDNLKNNMFIENSEKNLGILVWDVNKNKL
ncbi:class I SAM-dependent methyltransferase [Clostridium sp. CCUG 7971]|uniref:class I SAM-dependent methyltransferase n=1 Tax=Clostridium sp. CCUG 7971 TaxID=2811414 RepID=UPI001ABB0FE7|nr:class I SAM-dependent methyltransferase [Clostridium sp. CCUG 7971]MBO3444974.1 class I SAM-dependent methyltransferase [Clostridium sp. CCUG 7971]